MHSFVIHVEISSHIENGLILILVYLEYLAYRYISTIFVPLIKSLWIKGVTERYKDVRIVS